MLIFVHTITARSSYIFQLIFSEMMGIEVELTDDAYTFSQSDDCKLAYVPDRIGDALFIQAHGLLESTGIREIEPDVFSYKEHKAFFRGNGDMSFDLFAASFYLVSRYEEYLPSQKDQYGRFQAKNALALKNNFLQVPIIHYWVEELKQLLTSRYAQLKFKQRKFKSTISFDIDVAYAFKGRNFFKALLAASKDLLRGQVQHLLRRARVTAGKEADPYDTYEYIESILKDHAARKLFFFLLKAGRTRYDRNISPSSSALKELVTSVAAHSEAGIHPSYYSSDNASLLLREKRMLENIVGKPVTKSRQHYLRFQLPDTYMQLIELGITDEYSMAFAETPGFRAGLCIPFPFYNLREERQTSLTIHPVSYMEGSFIEDMHLTPDAACVYIADLIAEVKKYNGHFLCIWHNHTLSNEGMYKGWRKSFEKTLELLKDS